MNKQLIFLLIGLLLVNIVFAQSLGTSDLTKDNDKIVFTTNWNSANIELKEDTFWFADTYDLDFIESKDGYIIKPTISSKIENKDGYIIKPTISSKIENNYVYTLTSDSEIVLLEEINQNFTSLVAYTYSENPDDEWNEFRQEFDFDKECLIDCSWDLSKDKKVLTLKFKQSLEGMNLYYTNLTGCTTLSSSGSQYSLNKSITSTATCMTFTGDNILLDCNGYTITYGTTLATSKYGVYFSNGADGNTLRDCNIRAGNIGNNNYPIYNLGDYETIEYNNLTSANGGTTQNGLYMVGGVGNNVTGNNITTFTGGTDNMECYSSCSYNRYVNNSLWGVSTGISSHTNGNNNLYQGNKFYGIANSISIYNGASNNLIINNRIQDGIIYFSTGTDNDNVIRDNWINTTGNRNPITFGASLTSNRNDIINNTIYISYDGRSGIQIQGTGASNSNKDTSVINNTIYGINTGTVGIAIFPRSENTLVEGNNVYMYNTGGSGIRQYWRNYADPNHIVRNNNVYINNTGGMCYGAEPNFQYIEMNWSGNYCETNQIETIYFRAGCQNNEVEWTMEDFTFNNTAKGKVRYLDGSFRMGLDDDICNGVWVYKYIKEEN